MKDNKKEPIEEPATTNPNGFLYEPPIPDPRQVLSKTLWYLDDQAPTSIMQGDAFSFEDLPSLEKLLSDTFESVTLDLIFYGDEDAWGYHLAKLEGFLGELEDCGNEQLSSQSGQMKDLEGWRAAKKHLQREYRLVEHRTNIIKTLATGVFRLIEQKRKPGYQSTKLEIELVKLIADFELLDSLT